MIIYDVHTEGSHGEQGLFQLQSTTMLKAAIEASKILKAKITLGKITMKSKIVLIAEHDYINSL